MAARGIRHEIVSYTPKRFKHWPPYYGLLEMCLTNATLPSKSLGGSSCSLKYKKAPQDAFLRTWQPAVDAWGRGESVIRLIGYDAGPRDTLRANHALSIDDPLYDCRYPLREWCWDRAACEARVKSEGLPVPPKSACWICVAKKPEEIRLLPAWCLRLIVLVEARAAANWLRVAQRVRLADAPGSVDPAFGYQRYLGRVGVVWRPCHGGFEDHCYVFLDPVGGERTDKIIMVELRDLEPVGE